MYYLHSSKVNQFPSFVSLIVWLLKGEFLDCRVPGIAPLMDG